MVSRRPSAAVRSLLLSCTPLERSYRSPPPGTTSRYPTPLHLPSSDPSAPSTSAGAAGQTSSHEAAGNDLEFPLPHPSDTASTSRPPLGSGRQRQRGLERSYLPEFLHLNASFQKAIKLLGQQITAGFNMLNTSIMDFSGRLDRLHSDANQSPRHCFFQSVLRQMENLTLDLQMHVMQGCHTALVQAMSPSPSTYPAPTYSNTFPLSSHRPSSYHSFVIPSLPIPVFPVPYFTFPFFPVKFTVTAPTHTFTVPPTNHICPATPVPTSCFQPPFHF